MANPKIQLRHDTAANWTSVNPVLLEGEVGIETDTRKQKFGDGTTAWNSLPYDMGSTALQSDSIVTPLSYRTSGISTTVIGTIDSNGYLNGATSSAEAEFVPETTVASQIIFNDVFSFNSHSAWTNDAMLDVVFSEPFTVGNTTSDTLSLYATRYGTIYFIIGDNDYIYSSELIGGSGTYDSEINLVLTFTDSGDNWTIGTGVTNFDGSTWKYGNSSGTCVFNRIGANTATIPKTAKIKEFVLYNSAQSRMDTINTSVQIGTTIYTINSDSAGLKLSYNSDNLKVNNNNQLDTVVELSELATQNWVTNQGYLTAITSSNVTTALGYTPVNKAGDTMTGTLTLNGGTVTIKHNTITRNGTNPTASSYKGLNFVDNSSTPLRFGLIESSVLTNGGVNLNLYAYKNQTTNETAKIELGWTGSGTRYCTFPNTTCCDGQWVNCFVQLTTTTAIGDYRIDLTNYLPNDGYKYEIMLSGLAYNSTSTYTNIYLNNTHGNDGEHYVARVGTNSRMACIDCILPVDSGRSIYMKITDHAVTWEAHDGWTGLYLVGYRRIGSNS